MDRAELLARADLLARGEASLSDVKAHALIEAGLALCEEGPALPCRLRQISHAIALAELRMWRAVGAAMLQAFGTAADTDPGLDAEQVTLAELRALYAALIERRG